MERCQTRKGPRHYRYYICTAAQKRGWQGCPSKAVPAGEIEPLVLEQIRERGCQVEGGSSTCQSMAAAACTKGAAEIGIWLPSVQSGQTSDC
jgi:site-specific DNA recombinase